jgi:chemotaxis protein methyltransferase CheR
MSATENQNIEIKLLLEAIYLKYGHDFRNYAKASLKRRLLRRLSLSGLKNLSEMQNRLLNDTSFMEILLVDFSINVTEMFRDPAFYRAIREQVIPYLRTYPFINIWHAGCATGEEVYSLAILLKESGLLKRTQIYATDYNDIVLKKALTGIFPIDHLKEYTANYQKSGGTKSLSDYYTADSENIMMHKTLKENIVFANHNLVTDGVFNEMNLILCRNVLIYFNKSLQNRVIGLFRDSLCHSGFLGIGSKESLRGSEYAGGFEEVAKNEKIYRKKGGLHQGNRELEKVEQEIKKTDRNLVVS